MEEQAGDAMQGSQYAFAPLREATLGAAIGTTWGAARTLLRGDSRWRAELASHIRPQRHDHIVDLACGGGELVCLLANLAPAARIIGVDADAAAIARAQSRMLGRDPRPGIFHAPLEEVAQLMGQESATKVIVTLTDIHRAAEKLQRLHVAQEIIDPRGVLFVLDYGAQRTPLMRSLRNATHALRNAAPAQDHDAITRLIRGAGFVAVDEAVTWPTPFGAVSLYRARAS